MPVRNTGRSRGPQRSTGRPAAKAAPAKPALTEYNGRPATDYHKAFAGWIVREGGIKLSTPEEKKAFLAGIRLAVTTRNLFNASDFYEKWREESGIAKPGRKRADETPAAPASRKRKPEPEPEPEPEDEEDFDEEEESEDDFDDESDDFEDDDSEDDDEFEDDEEEEEEPTPAPKRPAGKSRTASGGATRQAPVKGTTARKAVPAKATGRKPKPAEDDEFIF